MMMKKELLAVEMDMVQSWLMSFPRSSSFSVGTVQIIKSLK
jgi:hypothetical protein